MASYNIVDFSTTDQQLLQIYQNVKLDYQGNINALDIIFSIALRDKSLFPNINLQGNPTASDYIYKWVKGYVDAFSSLPSTRTASPKSSCSDPAIKVIVQTSMQLADEEANNREKHHNLFMSAENIQGNLLEEYIARNICQYGWLWCNGNVLRSVDFCNTSGTALLQIKNKSNTENSSSSAIRAGTGIKKWYRLGTRKQSGIILPRYMWDELNDIINAHSVQAQSLPKCSLSEENYLSFLRDITQNNRNIITDR